MDEVEVLAALQAALLQASDWFSVGDALRAARQEALAPHVAAFSYMLVERDQREYRARYGPIAPMIESADGIYPAPLERLPAEAPGIWAWALAEIDAPLLQSRYGDLLWCLRHEPAPHLHARAALAAYETLSAGDDELLMATHSSQRALELALEINDREAVDRVASAAVARAVTLLEASPERPGIVLRLLEAAAALPVRQRPGGLMAAALLAERVYTTDARLGDVTADLIASIEPDPTARREVRRRQVARWQTAIAGADAITRQVDIQHALELSSLHGLDDLGDSLRLQLQATLAEPIELKEFSGEVVIPRGRVDREIDAIVGADSAVDALRRLAARCPAGEPEERVRLAQEIRGRHPIQFLVTRLIVSEENIPLRIFTSPDDHLLAHVRQQEVTEIRLFAAAILVPALEAIALRYGAPQADDLAASLESPTIDTSTAEILARHVVAVIGGGGDESAAHVLAPRIERILRELARQAGLVVIREPTGTHSGGVLTLGAILSNLEGIFPERWRRYYACLLIDDLGINMRNRIAHGLVERIEHQDAVLLAHAAMSLSLFRTQAPEAPVLR